jgi:hypothetical protein
MTTREEAAAKAVAGVEDWFQNWPENFRDKYREIGNRALAAADAHDAAHNVHRLVIDDATVERAARGMWVHMGNKADDWVYCPPEDGRKVWCMDIARAVLAAVVQEGQG